MTPTRAIANLDEMLSRYGQPATLRRIQGTGPSATEIKFDTRAHVRAVKEDELIAGQSQDQMMAIMSPSDLGTWGVPVKGHKLIIDSVSRNIDFVRPLRMAGTLVRIEMRVSG